MTTEQSLKDQCTPEFIKWMCELAEGFEIMFESIDGIVAFRLVDSSMWYSKESTMGFSLLIHRAVEGLNKLWRSSSLYKKLETALYCVKFIGLGRETVEYKFDDYKLQSLTQAECAMLHCLLDIFKEEE